MFITIEPYQHDRYTQLLTAMFASRPVGVGDDKCRAAVKDLYDEMLPVYLIDTDLGVTDVFASARLLPSTGPTVSQPLIRSGDDQTTAIASPAIWEASRVYLGDADDPLVKDKQFRRLVMACHRIGTRSGIEALLMVLDHDQFDCCARSGVQIDLLGTSSTTTSTVVLLDITTAGVDEVRRRHERLAALEESHREIALSSFAAPGHQVRHTASRFFG